MHNSVEIINTAEVPVFNAGGALLQFLTSGVQLGESTLDATVGVLPASVFVSLHSHSGAELFFVLEGELHAFSGDQQGGEWKRVQAGELVVIPGEVRHAWHNRSNSSARVLSFAGKSIFEIMKKVAVPVVSGVWATSPSAEHLRELEEIAKANGSWLATPEENAMIGLNF